MRLPSNKTPRTSFCQISVVPDRTSASSLKEIRTNRNNRKKNGVARCSRGNDAFAGLLLTAHTPLAVISKSDKSPMREDNGGFQARSTVFETYTWMLSSDDARPEREVAPLSKDGRGKAPGAGGGDAVSHPSYMFLLLAMLPLANS